MSIVGSLVGQHHPLALGWLVLSFVARFSYHLQKLSCHEGFGENN
jgi:hypothetical protein